MKSKQTIIAAILALSFAASVSGQEEFRFKLYLESLSNGKKDTLDLAFSEQGYRNTQCEYDSISGLPVENPFGDTVFHLGALASTQNILDDEYPFGPSIVCPYFFKKRTTKYNWPQNIIFPENALPVRVSWDSIPFEGHWAILEDGLSSDSDNPGWEYEWPETIWMDRSSSYILGSRMNGSEIDRNYYHVFFPTEAFFHGYYHPDSTGMYLTYRIFFVRMKQQTHSEEGSSDIPGKKVFVRNPVKDVLHWKAPFPIKTWEIRDQSGRLMQHGDGYQNEIDCSSWAPGLYFLQWRNSGHRHGSEKVIKI